METKEFSTVWLRERLAEAEANNDKKEALEVLCDAVAAYIAHISKNAHLKGCGTSEKKAATSAANGRKGGRPNGSKNKPKVE